MRRASAGFTLIETMVVVAVIAVLLAVSLPALRGARVTAESTACLANLSSIAKLQASYAAGNNGQWPNDFEPGTPWVEWSFNNVGFVSPATAIQSDWWPGPLWAKGYYESHEPTEGVSCPVVHRRVRDTTRLGSDYAKIPISSYRYSPAMFTEARLWDPTDASAEAARTEELGPDRFRKSVRLEEVKFPSHKVVMSERADYHGRGAILGDPDLTDSEKTLAKANASFADAHVERVEPYRAQRPLTMLWYRSPNLWDGPGGRLAIPFSAAAWGHRGRDY